ncbi:MAG: regulatory protein GemA [Pseudomonadota bacterium]
MPLAAPGPETEAKRQAAAAKRAAKQEEQRKGMLAKIHIGKGQVWPDDDCYRAFLRENYRVESAANLSMRQLDDLLEHMKSKGFVPKKRYKGRPRNMGGQASRAKQLQKIEAYLAEAGRPWSYADSMAKRICKVDQVAWVETRDLYKIIAALEYNAKRHGRATG